MNTALTILSTYGFHVSLREGKTGPLGNLVPLSQMLNPPTLLNMKYRQYHNVLHNPVFDLSSGGGGFIEVRGGLLRHSSKIVVSLTPSPVAKESRNRSLQ